MILHRGGQMLLTRTRLNPAIPASRKASSNDCKLFGCLPSPLVKNIRLGTKLSCNSNPPFRCCQNFQPGREQFAELYRPRADVQPKHGSQQNGGVTEPS